jgi:hypothetical protein
VNALNRLDNKVDVHIIEDNNISKKMQESLDSLYTDTQNILNMNRNFYKMFIGVSMTQFNDINPLMNNSLVGWAWCEGQTLSVAEYPDLYAVIGNRWGGTANVDFKLPDTRNRVLRNTGANMGWGYQDDAVQKITGGMQGFYWRGMNNGATPTGYGAVSATGGGNSGGGDSGSAGLKFFWLDWNFDSARVVRTADETRVKSLPGRTFMITKVLV